MDKCREETEWLDETRSTEGAKAAVSMVIKKIKSSTTLHGRRQNKA